MTPKSALQVACVTASLLFPSLVHPTTKSQVRPREFGIVFETSRGERIDTFAGVVTKDLVSGPDTTIALRLTAAELDTLYMAVVRGRTFELPQPHPAQDPTRGTRPQQDIRLEVRMNGASRKFSWSTGTGRHADASDEWSRLDDLLRTIRRLVRNHTEYQSLPNARGVYR